MPPLRAGLFADLHGHDKFEVSGLTEHNGEYVMVFDSLMELGFTDPRLPFMGANNYLAGESGGESEYEAIVTRTKTSAPPRRRPVRPHTRAPHAQPPPVQQDTHINPPPSAVRTCTPRRRALVHSG